MGGNVEGVAFSRKQRRAMWSDKIGVSFTAQEGVEEFMIIESRAQPLEKGGRYLVAKLPNTLSRESLISKPRSASYSGICKTSTADRPEL